MLLNVTTQILTAFILQYLPDPGPSRLDKILRCLAIILATRLCTYAHCHLTFDLLTYVYIGTFMISVGLARFARSPITLDLVTKKCMHYVGGRAILFFSSRAHRREEGMQQLDGEIIIVTIFKVGVA